MFKIIVTENLGLPLIRSERTLVLYKDFMSTRSIKIATYWDNFVALGTLYVKNVCLKFAWRFIVANAMKVIKVFYELIFNCYTNKY